MPLGDRLVLFRGDITTLDVDAIVNAANVSLAPGGGVCGAIHRAAGPDLACACEDEAPCPTGEARVTPGYRLKARSVIHAVGPVWRGGGHGEDAALASCYRQALRIANERGFRTVAFPAISTGVYGFPLERATTIALRTIGSALAEALAVHAVTCVCFDEVTHGAYVAARRELDL